MASNALRGSVANGALRRTASNQRSASSGSSAQAATVCWASTSSGFVGTRIVSISPDSIRRTVTAQPIRSVRCFGNSTPWEISPTWWPALPMRCSPLATDGGVSTWITRSTAPMSMPSSRLDVATTALSRPVLRSSSTSARCSLLTEPWWALASRRSAPERLTAGHYLRRCAAADLVVAPVKFEAAAFGVNLVEPRRKSFGKAS